ncbi:MAG: PAS domain S-box protein, partial [Pirellulaceae bacterium]|nr:PAS domain S-box protein [Pirellulaceae bacterium]
MSQLKTGPTPMVERLSGKVEVQPNLINARSALETTVPMPPESPSDLPNNVTALERQIRLYDAVVSNTDDFLYVFDLQHRFIFANRALLTVWGKSWEAAIGKTCAELGYEPWHAAMHGREIDHVVATGQAIRGEVPFTGTTGQRVYEYIFVPVMDVAGNVEAVAGTTRDVTERRMAEEALRARESRLRKIFEHAGTGIAITDIQGRFVQCNPAYCQTIGYDEAGVQQASMSMLVHQDDRAENLQLVKHLISGTIPSFEIENRYIKRDGSAVWVHKFVSILRDDPSGTAHVIELVTDITHRKQSEAKLRSSEQFNRSVMDASADCIKIMDVSGRLLSINATGLRLMEIERVDALQGNHWSQ